jgi:hypothetical protein
MSITNPTTQIREKEADVMALGLIKMLQRLIVDEILGKEFDVEDVIVDGLWTETGLFEPCLKTGNDWRVQRSLQ